MDLDACVQSGVEFVRPIARAGRRFASFRRASDADAIQGNEDAIRQIILNLTCNAIRHTPAGGTIEVSIRRSIDATQTIVALVEIADTGCGIPDSNHRAAFRGRIQWNGDTPGLGLAVCKRLMTQHGGEIRVSQPRQISGSNFPIGVSNLMTNDAELSVMVVDDEPGIRTALRANFLRQAGGSRRPPASARQSATVEGREFDLVVTDIRMPDGTGMEVMRAVRKSSPGTGSHPADRVRFGARRSECDARWRAGLSDQADFV